VVSKPKITDQQPVRKKATLSSFDDEFLDTDRLRQLPYGNLVLRRQAHRFLAQGVVTGVLLLTLFWLIAANWQQLTTWTGLFNNDDATMLSHEMVTQVTLLPPPAPLNQRTTAAAPPNAVPPPLLPTIAPPTPNIGIIKPISQTEVPSEQSVATQSEQRQATQTPVLERSASATGGGGGAAMGDNVPMVVACDPMPSFREQKKPLYPERARSANITGKVFVAVLIGEDGRPINAKVTKRVPADCDLFDAVAIKSVMASKYYPGILNGKPVKVWFTVPIRFQLE